MNICGVCSDELNYNIIKLKCNHEFHYKCIEHSYRFAGNKLCPYCRQYGGHLLKKNIIINNKPIEINPCKCHAILKTGKNKGQQCNYKISKNNFCKRHCPKIID